MGVLIVANVLFLLAYCARAIYFAKLFIVKNIIIAASDTDIHNIIKYRKKMCIQQRCLLLLHRNNNVRNDNIMNLQIIFLV